MCLSTLCFHHGTCNHFKEGDWNSATARREPQTMTAPKIWGLQMWKSRPSSSNLTMAVRRKGTQGSAMGPGTCSNLDSCRIWDGVVPHERWHTAAIFTAVVWPPCVPFTKSLKITSIHHDSPKKLPYWGFLKLGGYPEVIDFKWDFPWNHPAGVPTWLWKPTCCYAFCPGRLGDGQHNNAFS